MADNRRFWIGALWGAAAACVADLMVRRGLGRRRRLTLVGGRTAEVLQLPVHDAEAHRTGEAKRVPPVPRPVFERRRATSGSVPAGTEQSQRAEDRPGQGETGQ